MLTDNPILIIVGVTHGGSGGITGDIATGAVGRTKCQELYDMEKFIPAMEIQLTLPETGHLDSIKTPSARKKQTSIITCRTTEWLEEPSEQVLK